MRPRRRRGVIMRLWDTSERPWYVVCPCIPGVLYRVLAGSFETSRLAESAARRAGWIYTKYRGYSCPECCAHRAELAQTANSRGNWRSKTCEASTT